MGGSGDPEAGLYSIWNGAAPWQANQLEVSRRKEIRLLLPGKAPAVTCFTPFTQTYVYLSQDHRSRRVAEKTDEQNRFSVNQTWEISNDATHQLRKGISGHHDEIHGVRHRYQG